MDQVFPCLWFAGGTGEPEGIIASALTILNPNLVKLIARIGGGWVLIFNSMFLLL
jgi:hypothetical protein